MNISFTVESTCKAVKCESSPSGSSGNQIKNREWSITDDKSITIYSNACKEEEEWFMSDNWYGTCEPKVDRIFDYFLYPGYRCKGDEVLGVCRFGTKICNQNYRCEGIPLYGSCKRSGDCNFGSYCNEDGICLELNQAGERCTTHDSWVKNHLCFFETATQAFGTCVAVISRDERELVLPEHNDLPALQEDMEKLCRSGMVNRTTGRCASILKSKNKGKVCKTDADCPTTDENIKAQCKWGFNSDGNKYCDIEAGDEEWVTATRLFQEFHLLNLDWHTTEGFGEWGKQDSMMKQYKWAEFKAKYYVELLNNPQWVKDNYEFSPLFWEYHLYWYSVALVTIKIVAALLLVLIVLE